jgi:ArsR family transcriptional regulator
METDKAVLALEALAQQSRIAIFRLLVEAGPGGMPAGEIAASMGLPGATLSFHLSQLKHAGLITCLREGRSLIYSADFAAMNELVGFLTDHCCGGDISQCAPVCSPPAARTTCSLTPAAKTRTRTRTRTKRKSS